MHDWDDSGNRLGPNSNHFVITKRTDGRQSAHARPDAGHIADEATSQKTVREILRRFPSDKCYVQIVVNDDSFSQFQTLKESLVDPGYQYERIPRREDDGVWDQGGVDRGQ
jgi:hypothetical protein